MDSQNASDADESEVNSPGDTLHLPSSDEVIRDRRALVDHLCTANYPTDEILLLGVIATTLLDLLENNNEALKFTCGWSNPRISPSSSESSPE